MGLNEIELNQRRSSWFFGRRKFSEKVVKVVTKADLALLKLNRSFGHAKGSPVCLPPERHDKLYRRTMRATISGYRPDRKRLRKARMRVKRLLKRHFKFLMQY